MIKRKNITKNLVHPVDRAVLRDLTLAEKTKRIMQALELTYFRNQPTKPLAVNYIYEEELIHYCPKYDPSNYLLIENIFNVTKENIEAILFKLSMTC